jgi:hypothetical protein
MKTYLFLLSAVLLTFVFGFLSRVEANEGRIVLKNGQVVCEGLSIWQDDRYRIVGRCNGLVYPYQEKLDHYTIWVHPDGAKEPVKLDDIERGIFEGRIRQPFTSLFITADEDGSGREPGNVVIAASEVQRLDFAPPATEPVAVPGEITPTPSFSPNPTARPAQSLNISKFISGRPVIFLIIAVVVVVVILALVWR